MLYVISSQNHMTKTEILYAGPMKRWLMQEGLWFWGQWKKTIQISDGSDRQSVIRDLITWQWLRYKSQCLNLNANLRLQELSWDWSSVTICLGKKGQIIISIYLVICWVFRMHTGAWHQLLWRLKAKIAPILMRFFLPDIPKGQDDFWIAGEYDFMKFQFHQWSESSTTWKTES